MLRVRRRSRAVAGGGGGGGPESWKHCRFFVESRPCACQHKGGHCSADSGCAVGWWAVLGSVSVRLLANAQFSLSHCLFLTEAATRTPSSRQQDRTCTGAAATTKPDPAAAVRRRRRRNRPERPGHRVFVCLLRGGGEGVRGGGGDRPTKPSSVRWPRRAPSILSRVGLIIATLRMRLRSCVWTPLDRGGDGRSGLLVLLVGWSPSAAVRVRCSPK